MFRANELAGTALTAAQVVPLLGTLAAASVIGSYTKIVDNNGAGHRILWVKNKLDLDVYVSLDGTNNHYMCPGSGDGFILDLGSDETIFHGDVWVKTVSGGTASSGNIYVGLS